MVTTFIKKVLSILLLFSFVHSTYAIKHYKVSDTLYVWAKNGLFLRSEPSATSEKLTKLEYGAELIIVEQVLKKVAFSVEEFKGYKIKGYWVEVSVNNQIGYVFDGYLSKLKPLRKDNRISQGWEDIETYANREFKVLKSWSKNLVNTMDTKIDSFSVRYKNGNRYTAEIGSYASGTTVYFKHLSFEEAYLFAYAYFNWTKETFKIISIQDKKITCDFELIDQTGGECSITIEQVNQGVEIVFGFAAP